MNDLTGESYQPGSPAIVSTRPRPGSRDLAPSDAPGWRLTSDGGWENDLTGQVYRVGDDAIGWLPRPSPGSTPEVPPTADPGWRWTSEGAWVNDLTRETYRPGDPAITPSP